MSGKTVLDYGCGTGWLSILLAREGASVHSFDISSALVDVTLERAKCNGLEGKIKAKRMLAEELGYPSEYFDAVFGVSILHHVELDKSVPELTRILKRGGKAVFIEPLGESNVLNLIRKHILRIHHGMLRPKDTEEPLTYETIRLIGLYFSEASFKEFQFISMLERFLGYKVIEALGIDKLDSILLEQFPVLKKLCRTVVLSVIK